MVAYVTKGRVPPVQGHITTYGLAREVESDSPPSASPSCQVEGNPDVLTCTESMFPATSQRQDTSQVKDSGVPRVGNVMPFKLLGILDVENIPCARDSVLYGSLGSVVAGLGHFLLTSRIRRSCDVGVGGFILVTLGCWFHCRYNYAKLRIQERMAREGIKNKILYESTHLDPEKKPNSSSST
ncbi:PREDICTED: cytochrome c oxidase protein 20 homolog [Myotis brandtii]|nr:PREDICTED: cytochrome c oxidase protein 20 homolog [Myotis brandtii]